MGSYYVAQQSTIINGILLTILNTYIQIPHYENLSLLQPVCHIVLVHEFHPMNNA